MADGVRVGRVHFHSARSPTVKNVLTSYAVFHTIEWHNTWLQSYVIAPVIYDESDVSLLKGFVLEVDDGYVKQPVFVFELSVDEKVLHSPRMPKAKISKQRFVYVSDVSGMVVRSLSSPVIT